MRKNKPKIIVILGPTSSGKSDAAIRLARKFQGEVVSADSRQIYRGMDIGSGKVTGSFESASWNEHLPHNKDQSPALLDKKVFVSGGVRHYMIDIVSPKTDYSAAQFQKKANRIIKNILERNKLPIICGGTGFWIKALVDNVTYPEVKPDWELRNLLRNKSAEELFKQLSQLDTERAGNIDPHNKVRLIRAIEICQALGQVPKPSQASSTRPYDFLQIGLAWPKEELYERIHTRLEERFDQGMIEEVDRLHRKEKVSWKRLEQFGLEYRWITRHLKGEITLDEMKEKLFQESKNYAKRQMTWFKKDPRIQWLTDYPAIEKAVQQYLKAL